MAWAQVIAAAITFVVVVFWVVRHKLLDLSSLRLLRAPLAAALLLALVFWALTQTNAPPARSSLLGGLLLALVTTASYAVTVCLLDRQLLADARQAFRRR
jgi:hypothetical protein